MDHGSEINRIINELSNSVNLLSVTTDEWTKNYILNTMRCKIYDLYLVNNLEYSDRTFDKQKQYGQNVLPSQAEPTFSKNQLAKYNGINGMPAYVAINGNVYDVTNVAAWGAATHFGLTAGNDLTAQFASCHATQPILQKLPLVGKMIE